MRTTADGSTSITRCWADVEFYSSGGTLTRVIVEQREPFVYGLAHGGPTTAELRRRAQWTEHRRESAARAAREEERDQFHHRLQLARDVVEEYGVPVLRARWDPSGNPMRRRRREEMAEDERRVRARWGDDAAQEDSAEAPQERAQEGRRVRAEWGDDSAQENEAYAPQGRAADEGPSRWQANEEEGDETEGDDYE